MKKIGFLILLLSVITMAEKSYALTITEDFTIGIQLANDFSFLQYPNPKEAYVPGTIDPDIDLVDDTYIDDIQNVGTTEYLAKKLNFINAYWVRADISATATPSDTTTVYYLMALRALGQDSGNQDDFSYTILQCEIDQEFTEALTFRIGRLAKKYSESRFFARVALGESDSHVFGRTPFVNDAVELSYHMDFTASQIDFYTGAKAIYMPFSFNGYYLVSQWQKPLENNTLKCYFTYSLNRQLDEELTNLFPSSTNDRYHHGFEGEVSYNINNQYVAYLNAGFLMNYAGYMPHTSGPRDILKGNQPIIGEGGDDWNKSVSETFIPMIGFKVFPSELFEKLSFFKEVCLETEVLGLGYEDMTAVNVYGHLLFKYNELLSLQYGVAFNRVDYADSHTLKDSSGNVVTSTDTLTMATHYVRVNLMF